MKTAYVDSSYIRTKKEKETSPWGAPQLIDHQVANH